MAKTVREVAKSTIYVERVKANWQVRNTRKIEVGPGSPTTLVQVRGGRAFEINHAHLEIYDVPYGTEFLFMICLQAPVWTIRKLAVDGVVRVKACEALRDIPTVEDALSREYPVNQVLHRPCEHFRHGKVNDPYHWFAWAGRREGLWIPSTGALGVVLLATKPCKAIATVSGN